MVNSKRTKIVCTIGPASERPAILETMIKSGMNVARLNMSHGAHANHALLVKKIRAAASKLKEPVAILADLQGPKIRIGLLPKEGVELRPGSRVVLTTELSSAGAALKPGRLPVAWRGFTRAVKAGGRVFLDDGLLELKVEAVAGREAVCKVVAGGLLTARKGINLPGGALAISAITAKDRADAVFAVKQDADFVALSFVRAASDVEALRRLLQKVSRSVGRPVPQIIAKIEKREALENFDEILAAADGIMIARGDLGIEIAAEYVPVAQKDIIGKCRVAAKPVIVATQMLDSMIRNPRPTRAEISDVANAVIDHADALMLSGETATGKFPTEAVKVMAETISDTEASRYDDTALGAELSLSTTADEAVQTVAAILARLVGARAIFADSLTGRTARLLARHREDVPVYVGSPRAEVVRQMNLLWGVRPFLLPEAKTVDELLRRSLLAARRLKVGKKGDKIVLLSGEAVGRPGRVSVVGIKEL